MRYLLATIPPDFAGQVLAAVQRGFSDTLGAVKLVVLGVLLGWVLPLAA